MRILSCKREVYSFFTRVLIAFLIMNGNTVGFSVKTNNFNLFFLARRFKTTFSFSYEWNN